MKPPNILLILSDQHRGQAMSHAGDPNVQTPAMDALAAAGVSFQRAYSNCPVCTPARGTIFSGRHAHAGPVQGFFDVYKPSAPSTATILREHGYHTAYFGKWHCGTVHNQVPKEISDDPAYPGNLRRTPETMRGGFQDWRGYENRIDYFNPLYYRDNDRLPTLLDGYETDAFTDAVIDYLKNYDRDEPLFLVLSVMPPHDPLIVPDKWLRHDPQALKLRPNFGCRAAMFAETWPEMDETTLRTMLARYYALVENLDWNIGRLMQAVQSMPRFADTLTIYTSDHGDHVGSHGVDTCKIQHFEESVRVPAIFHWPGHVQAAGGEESALFSLVDLMATTLGLAGLPVPSHNQGTDFSPLLRGEAFSPPADILLEMIGVPRWNLRFTDWRGLVTDRWKYAFYEDGHEELHDLTTDPYELENLAESQRAQTETMKGRLLHQLAATREPYFDVLITQGVRPEGPVNDVGSRDDIVRTAEAKAGLLRSP